MGLLEGKRGIVMGVANDHSIAWGIAKKLSEQGADLCFTYQGETLLRRIQPLAESMTLVLKPGKSLANANIDQVLLSLNESGFYLQMPPAGSSSNFKLTQLDTHHFLADSDEC